MLAQEAMLRALAAAISYGSAGGDNVAVIPVYVSGRVTNTKDWSFPVKAKSTVTEITFLDASGSTVHRVPVAPEEFSRQGRYIVPAYSLSLSLKEV